MRVNLLTVGVPTANGRIYPKEVVEAALKNIKEPIFGGIEKVSGIDDISHQVKNMRVEGRTLMADIQILATEKGQVLQEMLEKASINMSFSTVGVGRVDDAGIVTDFDLQYINASLVSEPTPQLEVKPISELGSRKLTL